LEVFYCGTKVVSGTGALETLQTLDTKRLFLVADPFFRESGAAQTLADSTKAAHKEIFSDIQPDPSVETVAAGAARLRAFAPDTVIALGGGSAMDCAKAMVRFSGVQVLFVAIPTTSGSGSEVTDFAVLTHGDTKYPLVDPSLRPQLAILDGSLLEKLPKTLIADTGFDVLCHALEGLVATGAGSFTDALAREAFCLAYANLPASFGGDAGVRLQVHEAATMAGMAFTQAGLGLCHAMAHSLGGVFHLPHGRLNAILLPAVVSCNSKCCGEKYASLARSAGIGGSADSLAVRNLKNALVGLRRALGLPRTLKEAGIDPRQVRHHTPAIITATLEDPCCKTNPLPVEESLVRQILEEVTGRG